MAISSPHLPRDDDDDDNRVSTCIPCQGSASTTTASSSGGSSSSRNGGSLQPYPNDEIGGAAAASSGHVGVERPPPPQVKHQQQQQHAQPQVAPATNVGELVTKAKKAAASLWMILHAQVRSPSFVSSLLFLHSLYYGRWLFCIFDSLVNISTHILTRFISSLHRASPRIVARPRRGGAVPTATAPRRSASSRI